MRVLVTGASGFVGERVLEYLSTQKNVHLVGTSRKRPSLKHVLALDNVNFVSADLNETKDNWLEFFQKPEKVIHLAWEGLPNYNSMEHIERNLVRNYRFVKNLVENGCGDITIVGTCFEYGNQEGVLSERQITQPNTPYAIAKDTLRVFLEQLRNHQRFDLKWVRLFYPYGDGQRKESLLGQLDEALREGAHKFNMSKGEQLRDYLHVDEMSRIISQISLNTKGSGIFNCGSGRPISVRAFVEGYIRENFPEAKIELNLGYYDYPEHEPMAFWADTSKLSHLGLLR